MFFEAFTLPSLSAFPGWENWHVERSTAIPDYHNTSCQACVSLPASAWHPPPFHLTCFKATLSSPKKSRTKRISPNVTHYTFSPKKYSLDYGVNLLIRIFICLWERFIWRLWIIFSDYSSVLWGFRCMSFHSTITHEKDILLKFLKIQLGTF